MHQAWYIEEIRCFIFEYLIQPGDLARLARTNKHFFEIATDQLWASLNSFRPFMCCLPPDFCSRPLKLEDVARLDFYAQKVRAIVLEETGPNATIRLPPPFHLTYKLRWQEIRQQKKQKKQYQPLGKSWRSLWAEIACLRPSTFFLSNLQRIRMSNVVEQYFLSMIGISGSQLNHLYIGPVEERQSDKITRRFLKGIQDTPKLDFVFVHHVEADILLSEMILNSPLTNLSLEPSSLYGTNPKKSPLHPAVLQNCTLQHLDLALTRDWYSHEIEAQRDKRLPALQTLRLNLMGFKSSPCHDNCINVRPSSWTCSRGPAGLGSGNDNGIFDCGRRPPTLFFERLDNPELTLLNIRFPYLVDRLMLLDTMGAAARNCRLDNLSELCLGTSRWPKPGERPPPNLRFRDLKDIMILLLPLPKLRVLRLAIGPELLRELDWEFYKRMASGFPLLQTLTIGHSGCSSHWVHHSELYNCTSLPHVAIFCRLLPNLTDLEVGWVDGSFLEQDPQATLSCPQVQKIRVNYWTYPDIGSYREGVLRDRFHRGIRTYFPNSDLAAVEFDPGTRT